MLPEHNNTAETSGDLWKTAYSTLTHLYDLMVEEVSNVSWLRGGLLVIEVEPISPQVTGELIAEMLAEKGYEGK